MPNFIFSTGRGVDDDSGKERLMSVGSAVTVVDAPRVLYCEPVPLNPISVGVIHLCAQTVVGAFVESVGKLIRRLRRNDIEIPLADEVSGDIINRSYNVGGGDNFYVGEFLQFDDEQWVVKNINDIRGGGLSITVSKIPRTCNYTRNPTYVELSDDCKKLGKILPSKNTNTVLVQHSVTTDTGVNKHLDFAGSITPRVCGLCLGHKIVKTVENRSKTKMLRIGASDNGGVYVACRAKRLARISASFDPTLVVEDVKFHELSGEPDKIQLIKCEGTTQPMRPQGPVIHFPNVGIMCVTVVSAFVFVKLAAFRGSTTAHDLRGLSSKLKWRYFFNPLNWF